MIEAIKNKININKVKKKKLYKHISFHKENKLGLHTTINGKGHVARLAEKLKNGKKISSKK